MVGFAPWALNNFRQGCAGISVPYSPCKIVLRPLGLSKMLLNSLSKPTWIRPNWPLQGWRDFTDRLHGLSFPHLTFPYFYFPFCYFSLLFRIFLFPILQIFPNITEQKPNTREENNHFLPLFYPCYFCPFIPYFYYFQKALPSIRTSIYSNSLIPCPDRYLSIRSVSSAVIAVSRSIKVLIRPEKPSR